MEKRVILAVVLCVAVLMLWSKLFPVKPPSPAPAVQATAQTAGAPPPSAAAGSAAVAAGSPTANRPEQLVTIETPGPREAEQQQVCAACPPPAVLDREVLGPPPHARRTRQALCLALARLGRHGIYFLEIETVSWRRPLRRRRRKISRPDRVFMRLRNPCVRLRLLRCG